MPRFYFNDCLPPEPNHAVFLDRLSQSLLEFNVLLQRNLGIERAIITERLPSEEFYGNTYSLQSILEAISDHDLKNLAYSLFYKYPVGNYFDDSKQELLEYEFRLTLDELDCDALNLAMVALSEGYLFTTALHPVVRNNPLLVTNITTEEQVEVNNLFGVPLNTDTIGQLISSKNAERQGLFHSLKHLLGECITSLQFEKQFGSLTVPEQQSILDLFDHAKSRNFKTPFYPDTKIIKDVSPENCKCKVYELRVYRPSALRVYFNEGEEKVFVASIGFKNDDNQDSEIKSAHTALYKLILTN